MKPRHFFFGRLLLPAAALISFSPLASAVVTTFTWTSGVTGNWNSTSTTTDWKTATAVTGAGNIVTMGTTIGGSTTTLNVSGITVGQIKNTASSGRAWTIADDAVNHYAITLDNTGGSTNIFGNANAAISSSSSGAMNVLTSIIMKNTDLDIIHTPGGSTQTMTIGTLGTSTLINGDASGTRILNLRFQGAGGSTGQGTLLINSAIGSSGSAININNLSTVATTNGNKGTINLAGSIGGSIGTGAAVAIDNSSTSAAGFTISGVLGASVTSLTQNSTTSTMTVSGANTNYAGTTNISSGKLQAGANTILGNVVLGLGANNGTLDTLTRTVTVSGLAVGASATAASQTIQGSGTLVYAGTSSNFAGNITGTQGLTVNSGILTLSGGGNSYSGLTKIDGGTLNINSQWAVGGGVYGGMTFGASGGTLQYNATLLNATTDITQNTGAVAKNVTLTGNATIDTGGNNVTFANTFGNSGAGAFTKTGAGVLTFGATTTYTGNTTVSTGTLALSLGSSTNNLTSSPKITVASGAILDVTALSGGIIALGATQTLAGSGTVTGGATTVSGTHLSPGVTGVSSGIGNLTLGSLTLGVGSVIDYDITNTSTLDKVTVSNNGGLSINGGRVDINGALSAFTANGVYNLIGYTGAIGGAGISALSVNASNKNTVTNIYTFGTAGGYVTLEVASSGGAVSYWNADAAGNWSGASWTTPVPNAAGAFASFGGGGTAITAPRTITVDGAYTVGTLAFNNGSQGYTLASGAGANLTLDNGVTGAFVTDTAGSHLIQAPMTLTTNGATFTVTGGSDTLTVSGAVGGTGTGLIKSGAGTLALNGTNNYAGGTVINAGTLAINSTDSLGDVGGTATINAATLKATADITTSRIFNLADAASTISVDATKSFTISSVIADGATAGKLNKVGTGTLVLSGTSNYTGGTLIGAGTLNVNGDRALGALPGSAGTNLTITGGATLQTSASFTLVANRGVVLSGGTATVDTNGSNLSIAGNISGSGLLNKTGAGNLTLTGANSGTASGGITINSGTVFTNDQSSLPSGTITLNGTGGISNGNNAANYSNVVVNGTNSIVKTGTGNILGLGAVSGAGTLTFGGTYVNDYTGSMASFTGTIIANGGSSRWNGSTGGTNVTLDLANTGTSVRNVSTTGITLGALAGSSTATISGSSGGATQAVTYTIGGKTLGGLGVTAVNSSFDGAITNGANTTSVTKVGLSTLTLNGISTYTGATTVSAGTLLVNGSLGNTAVAVGNTGTLGGSGTIGTGTASVSVNNGGTLAPGNSPGTVTVNGSTTLNSGSTYAYQYTGGGTAADLVDVNGVLTINTGAILTLQDLGAYTIGDKFTLFAYESLTGSFGAYADDQTYTFNGGDWLFDYNDTAAGVNGGTITGNAGSGFVTITAIPEPNAAMLVGGLGMLALLRRRRRA